MLLAMGNGNFETLSVLIYDGVTFGESVMSQTL